MKNALMTAVLALATTVGVASAHADQINMHASACVASGNGMLNVYPQVSLLSGLNSAATLLCPVPVSPTGAAKTLYVDGRNLVTNPTAPRCTATLMSYTGVVRGTLTRTAPTAPGSWELYFSLSGAMQPSSWDYLVLECTVNSTVYGGLLGYTVTN